jgi:hypothetical protein
MEKNVMGDKNMSEQKIIYIYSLEQKPTGKEPGGAYLASVELTGAGVEITTYDEKLKIKLREIFSQPFIRKVPTDTRTGVVTHGEEAVQPFTDLFFEEIIYYLHKYELYGSPLPLRGKSQG